MTTEEAITIAIAAEIAGQAKPHRQPFNKLQGRTAAADLSTATTELRKSFDVLGNAVDGMSQRIDQLAADVEYLKTTFTPGSPLRRFHS